MKQLVVHIGIFAVVAGMLWRLKVARLPSRWQRWIDAAEVATLAVLVGMVAVAAYRNVTAPEAWDFPVFYTVARNAVDGVSFYDPAELLPTFTFIQEQAAVPADWLQEFGFWYAPPTALILAPLGVSDFTTGLVIQYVVQGAFFAAAILLLHRFYPLRTGLMGLVEMTLLGMLFRPVLSAFQLAQIVFGALFFLVVGLWAARDHPWLAGISLGVGALFKHLLLIPAGLVLAMRKWRITLGALGAVAVTAVLAGIAFGFDVYTEFTTFGPGDRPPELALDSVIESLNGTLRRAFDSVPPGPGAIDAVLYPPYLVIAAVLTIVTVVVAWRARRGPLSTELTFSLIIVLSLIVYPNTLYNTLPLLIPPLVVLLFAIDELPFSRPVTVAVVAIQYGIVASFAIPAFLALAVTWAYLAVCVTMMTRRAVPAAAEAEPAM